MNPRIGGDEGDDVCDMPMERDDDDSGCVESDAEVAKWHFDGSDCARVWYDGCGATENVFDSQEKCWKRCNKQKIEHPGREFKILWELVCNKFVMYYYCV